jgi:(4S)-4-hydroxy-5-phosphonooxypentane-2,3-dione isomerase
MAIFHTAHLETRDDVVDLFRERILRHARITLDAEPGCQRFDVHQEASRSTLFLLIEIYNDEAALEAHRQSPHYLQFREDVKDWVIGRSWWYWHLLQQGETQQWSSHGFPNMK